MDLKSSPEQLALLEMFDNPYPQRDFVIYHEQPEFTSTCPVTGQPDFGTVKIWFQPAAKCVELKSLKLYLQAYRDQGIFYEAVTNRIANDLAEAMQPKWLKLVTDWRPRGGMSSTITVEVGDKT